MSYDRVCSNDLTELSLLCRRTKDVSRNLVLLLITIRLNDMILVKYSRFVIAVTSVEAITSKNREKIVTSRLTTVTRQCISKSSQLN